MHGWKERNPNPNEPEVTIAPEVATTEEPRELTQAPILTLGPNDNSMEISDFVTAKSRKNNNFLKSFENLK